MNSKHAETWTFGGVLLAWVFVVTMFDVDSSRVTQVALLGGLGAALAMISLRKDTARSH